ncbi:MAG TPA: aromatic ring-hydroxylating dioxygenase subunit alpha [Solirubrobacteraceae bacterium]|jgi:Rieske 2Fe-2S family protein
MAVPARFRQALAEHRSGYALPRAFALDPDIHEHELAAIWRQSWLFAGVSVQARKPGDFFRFDLDAGDSVVLVRDRDGQLRGLHNTCRHRGMPVCPQASGRVRRWVCPYHQWSYALDGRLLGSGGEEVDPREFGLRRAPVAEIGGLVFVWLGDAPAPLDEAARGLGAALAAQGLDRARVAHTIDYGVRANWKLVWENNRECWHCHAGHPEYIRANFDAAPDTPHHRRRAAARAAEHAVALAELEAPAAAHDEPGLFRFPSPGRWWSANRTPLSDGFVTESVDGRPVAPVMGDYRSHDVGTLRLRTVPNFWCHASADHAVLTRLLPAGPELTRIRVMWLVDGSAEPGRDYDVDRLLPFWRLTSEQDWDLCERNHVGVRNPAFEPGPYSPRREYNVMAFVEWYLARIGGA